MKSNSAFVAEMKIGDRLHFNLLRGFGLRQRYSLGCNNGYKLVGPTNLLVLDFVDPNLGQGDWRCYKIIFLNESDGCIGAANFFDGEIIIVQDASDKNP